MYAWSIPHRNLLRTAEALWNLLASVLAFLTTLVGGHTYTLFNIDGLKTAMS